MAVKKYNPDQHSIVFAGLRIQGWADGEFITAEMETPATSDVIGTDGEVAVSRSTDRRCTVTLKILQTASINADLSQMLNDGRDDDNGIKIGTFQLKDNTTSASSEEPLVYGEEAWLIGEPVLSRGRTANMLEWKVRIGECTRFEGGA